MRSLAAALAVKLVLVAEAADPSGMHVRVAASWYAGAPIEEPFEHDTAGQPCALVPRQTLVSFGEGPSRVVPRGRGRARQGSWRATSRFCLRDSCKNYLGHLTAPTPNCASNPTSSSRQDPARMVS